METMDRDKILSLLMISALKLWGSTLHGGRSPVTEALYHVLDNPQPGDLVLEITTRRNDHSRLGRLTKIVKEPVDDWSEENGPRPSQEYWYIETMDGEEQRWFNCKFIRVLEEPIDAIDEAKARNLITPALQRRLQEIKDRVDSYKVERESRRYERE